jgi:hypothetical protein
MVDRLVERGGTCILYTHLGKIDNPRIPFNGQAVQAFRSLAEKYRAGRILVTTTRRLLGYRRAAAETTYKVGKKDGLLCIDLKTRGPKNWGGELPVADLAGLTFYVCDPQRTRVLINGKPVADLMCNGADHTGRPSVSLPWSPLEFPAL